MKPEHPEISNLYRTRHAVNAMIKAKVEYVCRSGISKIVLEGKGGQTWHQSKCHDKQLLFFKYTIKRFKEKASEHGIETVEVSDYNSSTIYPKCRLDHTYKHKRLFKCLNCGLEARRDAVGVINMGTLCRGHRVAAHTV